MGKQTCVFFRSTRREGKGGGGVCPYHGVRCESLIEHREDLVRDVVNADPHMVHEARVQLGEVVFDQVVQFASELDARGATSDDGEVQEFAAGLLG